jgi:hypothetical protein
MVLSFVGVAVPEMAPRFLSSFSVMVEVEGVRENVLARGPKWVSLSFLVSFHDMAANEEATATEGLSGRSCCCWKWCRSKREEAVPSR